MTAFTRRSLVGRGLAGAGALAVPGSLLMPALASAQADDQTDALERLVTLEQAAELAYSVAADEGEVGAEAKTLFEELSIHSEDRETALSEALDQLLVDPPEKSSDTEDYESLEDFDPSAAEKELVAFLISLEEEAIAAYEEEEPELEAPDLARTAAQISASHAQALVALRLLAGEESGVTRLPARSTSATETTEEDSDS